jgi:tetratricopeptide (TPR) repeat protein
MDRAVQLAGERSDADALGPASFCIPQEVENRWAVCLLELGRSGRAIEAFERGLAELPATHYRNRGVFLGQLGFAYAVQGIPDAAVSYGRQAHEAARATASHRIVSELKVLRSKLRVWEKLSAVAEFQRETEYIGRPG